MSKIILAPLPALPTTTVPLSWISGEPTANRVFSHLQLVLGGESKEFDTPLGRKLLINRTLSNHISRSSKTGNDIRSRASMFTFLPELIEAPQEIWRTQHPSDRKGVYRMHFIKHVQLADKKLFLTLAVVADREELRTVTFLPKMRPKDAKATRTGTLCHQNHYVLPASTSRT